MQTVAEARAATEKRLAAIHAEEAKQAAQAAAELATRDSSPATAPQELFFTGKPYLEENGQYLFLFRHYDPELARWTTPDPSGFPDGANNHIYGGKPLSGIDPLGLQWSVWEFIQHFYFGGGAAVSLTEIGFLGGIKSEAERQGIIGRFGEQIHGKAEAIAKPYNGQFTQGFHNSYNFHAVHYVFGYATLSGNFSGTMTSIPHNNQAGGTWYYQGDANIVFSDIFSDPTDLLETIYGTSNPKDAPSWFVNAANLGGTPYNITGSWTHAYDGKGTYE
jgi:RHS repeat-associated protein